jgi:hypothetical protein
VRCNGDTQRLVLICIEMDTIHRACRRHRRGITEAAG